MPTFDSVLVANRGEIARRVIAAATARGLTAVAVYSDADAGAPHVAEADVAVRLPGDTPAETYLRGDLIIAAAQATGAQAIHPGYGFLSENAEFAAAVLDAGLVWIGPSPAAIRAMGAKIEAKRLLDEAGVPMLRNLDPADVADSDFPILVKASAGGGGRGMRRVDARADLDEQVASARREALSAFGDDAVFCERYLERGRHIEVQILADTHGTVWAVGERECSIQRRHQKVIEEAPSPLVERHEGMREGLFAAAVGAAQAINYVGAGTVEFLATDAGEYFFLEVNTRLQVEHPVTEATTGLDLVGLQFDVAAGLPLPSATPPPTTGWSIEARIYAEDPAHGYQPTAGALHRFEIPHTSTFSGPVGTGVRLDSAVPAADAVVEVFYDPMLAKVISRGSTRDEARRVLRNALRRSKIHGLVTNREQLVRVLDDPDFAAGDFSTAFLDEKAPSLTAPLLDAAETARAARAAVTALDAAATAASPLPLVPPNWRNVGTSSVVREFRDGSDAEVTADTTVAVVGHQGDRVTVAAAEVARDYEVTTYHDALGVPLTAAVDTAAGSVTLTVVPRLPDPSTTLAAGSLVAPMPGVVTKVAVQPGDTVVAGQQLVWMEAMKMEHVITATADAVVAEVPVTAGQTITAGAVLAVLTEHDQTEEAEA